MNTTTVIIVSLVKFQGKDMCDQHLCDEAVLQAFSVQRDMLSHVTRVSFTLVLILYTKE